ncbi:hypothetical protein HYS47_00745 [Candidatus Woesearchaeota archaeon]|nr:hypothetical protein [Candidatus Woesearchaeota archaeon]
MKKKRGVLVSVILLLVLPLLVIAIEKTEGGGGERTPQYVEQQIENAVLQRQDFNGVPLVSITATTPHGIITFPAGSTISVSEGVVTSSSVDYAVQNDIQLWFGDNVVLGNGDVTASSASDFSVCGVSVNGASDVDYSSSSQTLAFSSANDLFLDGPFSALENVGQTTIIFNDCNIVRIETVFISDAELIFKNPLSTGSTAFLPNNNFADLDGDGLSDNLEETNSLNKNGDDTDGDGVDDYDEMMRYPTDPKKVSTLGRPDNESVELMLNGSTSQFFYQGKDLLKELNLSKNALFVDSDRDGITDIKEATLDYDYENKDMDGDGLSDGFELRHGLDPKEQTSLGSFWKGQCSDCLLKIQGKAGDTIVLEFNDDSFTATLDEGMTVAIGDDKKNVIGHTATNDDATITHSITENQETITNTNADTSIHYDHYTDHIRHGTFTIALDKTTKSIAKATLDSPGIYFHDVYEDPNFKLANATFTLPDDTYGDLAQYYVVPEYSFASSFALYRPVNLSSYTITFGNTEGDYDAIVSLNGGIIELRGIVNYRRMGFHFIGTPMSQTFLVTNYTENEQTLEKTGESKQTMPMYPIIPKFQKLTDVLSSYSEDNHFVLSLMNSAQVEITIESVGQDEHAYNIFFEDVKVSGMNTDTGLTERWDWAEEKPNAVRAIYHNYLPWGVVEVDDIVAFQYAAGEQHQLISTIDSQKAAFHEFIDPYRIPICDAWSARYREQQGLAEEELPAWALQQLN